MALPIKQIQTSPIPANLNADLRNARFSIPRPRSFADFIIYPSRWKIPDFKNFSGMMLRIKTNLLYFQTNYLILSLAAFACMMILSMKTLLTGIVSSIIIILAILFFFEHIPQARQIKQNHPTIVIIGAILLIIVAWHALHTILIVVGAAMLPVPFWVLHAACRSTEGLIEKNRAVVICFANTPVGQIMQMLGIDPRVPADTKF